MRRDLPADAQGLLLPDGDHGLGEPAGTLLAALETLDAGFCIAALEEALERYQAPQIFNSDQRSQFTCEGFTSVLRDRDILISIDGRGRWLDNVFIESVKTRRST